MDRLPLIAPKAFDAFTPEEYHAYVKAMYELRAKPGSKVKPSFAEGITLSRTKKGALSARVSKKKRAFNYVLESEVEALAKGYAFPMSEVWNFFKLKKFVIARTRMEAEDINTFNKELPW